MRAKSYELGYEVVEVSAEEIADIAIGNTHGGIIAYCSDRTIPQLKDHVEEIENDGFYVMIQGIEDPYNFGYAIRSLYSCGVAGVVLPERNWMTAAGVVCRSSAGSSEMIKMYTADALDAIDVFKSKSYKVVCADLDTDIELHNSDMKLPVFLVVGGEKRGISRNVLDKADQIVKIPYFRNFNASLSAASATTMIGYEIMRQNLK